MGSIALTLIDDNPASLELLAAALQSEPIEVTTFENPEAALDHRVARGHEMISAADTMRVTSGAGTDHRNAAAPPAEPDLA